MNRWKNIKAAYLNGMQDGIPIALGYFAVSFSLGIAARNVGLSPFQGFLASALCNASAGEYALFTLIGAGAAYWELAVVTLITNARYFLTVPCPGIEPRPPALEAWRLGHWTSRGVLQPC